MQNDMHAFPDNVVSALAMLYTQNQDLTGKSPEEILRIYNDAWNRIHAEHINILKENR